MSIRPRSSWSPIATAPTALAQAKAAVVGSTLYLIGGWNGVGVSSSVYAYDIAAGTRSGRAVRPGQPAPGRRTAGRPGIIGATLPQQRSIYHLSRLGVPRLG